MAAVSRVPNNAIRNFAVALVLSPYGAAGLAGLEGDPLDPDWRAVSAIARHWQAELDRAATLLPVISLPAPLQLGLPPLRRFLTGRTR